MDKMSPISIYFYCMSVMQGLFFALILLGLRTSRARSNRILAALLLTAAAGFVSIIAARIIRAENWLRFFRVLIMVSLFSVPLLYIHVKMLIQKDIIFISRNVLHFFPIAAFISLFLIFGPPSYDLTDILPLAPLNHIMAIRGIWMLYILPYLYSIYYLLKRQGRKLIVCDQQIEIIYTLSSDDLRINRWVRILLFICSVYWLISLISFFYRDIACYYFIISSATMVMIYVTGFIAINKPEIFYNTEDFRGETNNQSNSVVKGVNENG